MSNGPQDLLSPLTSLAGQLENNLNRFLDDVAASAPVEFRDVLFESKQSSLGRAIAADVVDIIPVLGDAANFFRVRHAGKMGIESGRRVGRQALDLGLGSLPDPVGAVLDALTPTNINTYLREAGIIR